MTALITESSTGHLSGSHQATSHSATLIPLYRAISDLIDGITTRLISSLIPALAG